MVAFCWCHFAGSILLTAFPFFSPSLGLTVSLFEQSEECCVNFVSNASEGLCIRLKLLSVAVHDYQLALIVFYPRLVTVVQTRKIVDAYGLLTLASALSDLVDEVWHRRAYVDHEVGQLHKRHHGLEEVRIVVEVAVRHVALSVKVGRKDAGILKDRAVLYDVLVALAYLHHLLKALVEEIDLQVERPSRHVLIEVVKIGVVLHRFKTW